MGFHVICLNSVFTSLFPKSRMAYINISSILALQPLTTWANYCGGKVARDAVFRVLAVEQPQAVVLNYAPGPLDTPMIEELLADHRTHQVVRTMFEDLKRTGALLKPSDSAGKLVALQAAQFQIWRPCRLLRREGEGGRGRWRRQCNSNSSSCCKHNSSAPSCSVTTLTMIRARFCVIRVMIADLFV